VFASIHTNDDRLVGIPDVEFPIRRDDEDWHLAIPDDGLSHAAENEPLDPLPAMGPNDDYVSIDLGGVVRDFPQWGNRIGSPR